MTSRQAEKSAAVEGIEALGVDRYTFKRTDPKGVVLGFAAYPEPAIRKALIQLAKAFSRVVLN
jgi:GntR family transcriptional regulator/MocR family aminotransferase